jgi:DNA-binding CsgD family transcriptional regulator
MKLLAEARTGRGHVIVVTGPVGSGKTELLHAFAERATGSGTCHLAATASRAEQARPLGVLGQLFSRAKLPPESTDRVAQLLDRGAFSAMINGPENELDDVSARVIHSLCKALLELARRQPLVVAVDGTQYADTASLQCLLCLVRRLRTAPALVVLSEATGSESLHPLLQAELLHQPQSHRIQLGMLACGEVEAMLGQHLDAGSAERLAPECHAISGGNPLLVHGLIEDLRSGDSPARQVIPGAGFSQAMIICLYRCEPTMVKVARGLAILDSHGSPRVLGQILQMETESVIHAVDALSLTGVLDGGRFRHRAARTVVLEGTVPEERAALHARAARYLGEDGAPASIVARHLLSAQPVRADWVVPVLHEAADHALTGSDVDFAISCLRLAGQVSIDDAQRASSRAALARAQWRVDPSVAVRHVADLTRAAQAGLLKGALALAPLNWMMWFGRVDEARDALDKLTESIGTLDAETAESLYLTRLWLTCMYPSTNRESVEFHPLTQPGSPSGTNPKLPATRLIADVMVHGGSDTSVAGAERLLHGSRLDERTIGPVCAALAALIFGDRLALAACWCDSQLKEAEARRAPTWQALFTALRAEIALRQGDLRAAEHHARVALSLISPKSWGVAVGVPLATLLQAHTAIGRYESAVSYLRVQVPDALFQTLVGLRYLQARGRYFHAVGRFSAALAEFQLCGDLMAQWRLELPAFVSWRSDAAQTFLSLGHARQARDLVLEQLSLLGPNHALTRGISLRVQAAASGLSNRPVLLRQATEALEGCGDRLELAYALADLGQAYRALGQWRQARTALRRARHLAARCGAEALSRSLSAQVADPAPGRTRQKPAAGRITDLSEAERRVAALAAQGHTNRQIADRLYVTVSTVEQHLTKVYRKLRVNCRTDLPVDPDILDNA